MFTANDEKSAVIDIGSNSVRLMLDYGAGNVEKFSKTTRLGYNVKKTVRLDASKIADTVLAVSEFVKLARQKGFKNILAFATSAVRQSQNKKEFLESVFAAEKIKVQVISESLESRLALIGALGTADGGVIDIGGASTEIIVRSGGAINKKSIPIGAVTLNDICGQDKDKLNAYIKSGIKKLPSARGENFVVIGGSALTVAAIDLAHTGYDLLEAHGHILTYEKVEKIADKLLSLSYEKRLKVAGLPKDRADIIGGGCLLLQNIMEKLSIDSVFVSVSDNLEGYLIYKKENI